METDVRERPVDAAVLASMTEDEAMKEGMQEASRS